MQGGQQRGDSGLWDEGTQPASIPLHRGLALRYLPPVKVHICLTLQGPLPEAGWVFMDPTLAGHHCSPHSYTSKGDPVPLTVASAGFLAE